MRKGSLGKCNHHLSEVWIMSQDEAAGPSPIVFRTENILQDCRKKGVSIEEENHYAGREVGNGYIHSFRVGKRGGVQPPVGRAVLFSEVGCITQGGRKNRDKSWGGKGFAMG